MATVEVLLSKSCEACQWMVQYLVGQEGREITRSVFAGRLLNPQTCFVCTVCFWSHMRYILCQPVRGGSGMGNLSCKLEKDGSDIFFS